MAALSTARRSLMAARPMASPPPGYYNRPPPPPAYGRPPPRYGSNMGMGCVTSRGTCSTDRPVPIGTGCRCMIPGFGRKRGAVEYLTGGSVPVSRPA